MKQDSVRATSTILYFLAYSAIGATALVLSAVLASDALTFELNKNRLLSVLIVAGAFLAGCGYAGLSYFLTRRVAWVANLAVLSFCFVLATSVLIVKRTELVDNSVPVLLATGYALFAGLMLGIRFRFASIATVAAITVVASLFVDLASLINRASVSAVTRNIVQSAYYDLNVTTFYGVVPKSNRGGAIERYSGGLVLGIGNGRLFSVSVSDTGESVDAVSLPLRVPLNVGEFREDAGEVADVSKFRVADILVREQEGNNSIDLLASHHAWNRAQQCFTLRVSRIAVHAVDGILEPDNDAQWDTIYDSSPCLPLKDRGHAFGGHQAGGRMAQFGQDEILISVGDHTFDGNGSPMILPQDPGSDYGKIMRIKVMTGESSVFSLGHRNPQGLFIDPNGEIWSTEHGPQGGDELNRIQEGLNYGWPYAIYGTAYGRKEWPISKEQGEHTGYELPVYAWVPSIGISSLVQMQGTPFDMWSGDLVISSLMDKTLYRVRIRENRAVFVEPIEVGHRIRDLAQTADGSLIMWTDEASLVSITPAGQSDTGELLFSQCIGCHQIADGATHGIGPDLKGIVGQRIASLPGFDYSSSLSSVDGEWNRAMLDEFLADPRSFAPGTSMVFAGIENPEYRTKLIDYLETRR